MSDNTLQEFFIAEGELLDTKHAPRISLEKQAETNIWYLEKGEIDLFAVQLQSEAESGPHKFLIKLNAGALACEFPASNSIHPYRIVAATHSSTRIWKLSLETLKAKTAADKTLLKAFTTSLANWQRQLATIFLHGELALEPVFISPEKKIGLEAGQLIRCQIPLQPEDKENPVWIEVKKGALLLYDDKELTLSSPMIFPLYYNMWLKSAESAQIETYSTIDLLKKPWESSLSLYHEMFLNYLHSRQLKVEKLERARVILKKEVKKELIDKAFRRISSAFDLKKSTDHDPSDNHLINACQALGDFLHIPITLPPEKLSGEISTQIAAICGASAIRYRLVVLETGWWQKDCGPLLGFYGPKKEPVALLNHTATKYTMVLPGSQETILVDAAIAKNLAWNSYVFYKPLPKDIHGGWATLAYYVKSNKKEFMNVFFMGLIAALLALFPPIATQQIFDRVIPAKDVSLLIQVFIGLLLAAFSITLFYLIRSFSLARLEGIVSNQLQSSLWDRLLKLPTSFFRQYSVGDLINRVNSIEEIRRLISGHAIRVVLSGIFSLVYLFIMFLFSPLLSLVVLSFSCLSIAVSAICLYYTNRFQSQIFQLEGSTNGALLQIIQGIAKLRITGAEERAFAFWSQLFSASKRLEIKVQTINTILNVMNGLLPSFYIIIIFSSYLLFIQQPQGNPFSAMSLGSFLGFIATFSAFAAAIAEVRNTMVSLVPVMPLWERAKPILDEPTEVKENKIIPEPLKGEFSIDNVSFKYDPNGPPILKNVTIKAKPGEFIAIVGPSGCGKSTLIRLMLGFERPESGAIYYDGKDFAGLDTYAIRRQLGVVLQDDAILSGTIRDNVTCGRIQTDAEINHAFELSGFDETMKEFPMGLHTMFSSGGQTISGGQKQRLFIARALVANPKILIFDEATSALDNKSQDIVSKSIDNLHVTRLVIAHRLTTIYHADRIYVLDKGQVIDTGTFAELSSRPGLFLEMLKRQKL